MAYSGEKVTQERANREPLPAPQGSMDLKARDLPHQLLPPCTHFGAQAWGQGWGVRGLSCLAAALPSILKPAGSDLCRALAEEEASSGLPCTNFHT